MERFRGARAVVYRRVSCRLDSKGVWGSFPVISISLKSVNSLKYEAAACIEALNQIEKRKYVERLKRRTVKKILKYAMAFCEKENLDLMA